MPWILLAIAIAAEIAGTLLLKASDGLSKLWPSIGVAIGYAIAFALMAISLKRLEVGITYAIWSGVGIMGAAIGGVIFFDQHEFLHDAHFLRVLLILETVKALTHFFEGAPHRAISHIPAADVHLLDVAITSDHLKRRGGRHCLVAV